MQQEKDQTKHAGKTWREIKNEKIIPMPMPAVTDKLKIAT